MGCLSFYWRTSKVTVPGDAGQAFSCGRGSAVGRREVTDPHCIAISSAYNASNASAKHCDADYSHNSPNYDAHIPSRRSDAWPDRSSVYCPYDSS